MTDDPYKLNAELDSEYETKFNLLQDEYGHEGHGAVKETVYDLIDEAFDAHDLDLDDAVASDDDSDEEPLYNPFDHSESLTLDRDLLRDVLSEYDQPAIHPAHVSSAELPKSVAEKTAAVVAVARYRYLAEEGNPEWTPSNVSDLGREVQNVIGDADNRTVSKYREAAFGRINDDGGVGRPDNVCPSDVFDMDSVDEWVAETESQFVDRGDELPVAALENRREMAAELWKWVAPHEGVQECLDELDTAIEVATDGEKAADENRSDDAGGDDEGRDKLEEMERIEKAEEADDEDGDENQLADDRSDEEMAREVAERSGGEQDTENQKPVDDTDAEMVSLGEREDEDESSS